MDGKGMIILALAIAFPAILWANDSDQRLQKLEQKFERLESKFEGFKEGVVYGGYHYD